jgi:hypothetical protein
MNVKKTVKLPRNQVLEEVAFLGGIIKHYGKLRP